jgi:hypothetical protein
MGMGAGLRLCSCAAKQNLHDVLYVRLSVIFLFCNFAAAAIIVQATHCDAFVKLLDHFVRLERTGCFQDVQYNQVLQSVLLAQFEMQRRPGEFRADIDLPDDVVDRALQAWQAQQQVCGRRSLCGP